MATHMIRKLLVRTLKVIGGITADLTGNVTGNVTGNTAGVHTGAVVGDVTGGVKLPVQVALLDGAVTIRNGIVVITKASAAALTLAAPTAATHDGLILYIDATTAHAHTLTITGGLRGAGAGADVGTFGGAIGDGVTLVAYNAAWYPLRNVNVTFA